MTTSCQLMICVGYKQGSNSLLVLPLRFLLSSILVQFINASSTTFDPYQLNGGLITAVAGKDFVVIATDTRLIGPGGYDIQERSHTSTRLYSPLPIKKKCWGTVHAQDGSVILPPKNLHPKLFESPKRKSMLNQNNDGNNIQSDMTKSSSKSNVDDEDDNNLKLVSSWTTNRMSNMITPNNVMIGSAGCSVDCEVLKRTVRSEIRTANYFGELSVPISPMQMAILLSQILYSRRGFPYYSFCLVAGIDVNDDGFGQVYVFDAIGSYERVAVACTGTGRDLLQPILDRKFNSLYEDRESNNEFTTNNKNKDSDEVRMQPIGLDSVGSNEDDSGYHSVLLKSKRYSIAQRSTTVDCSSVEEVIAILVDAYRSVSEREIGVGDQIVLYTIHKTKDPRYETQYRLYTAPLKKH